MKLNREVILILAFLFFAVAMCGWDFNETSVHNNKCTMPVMDSNATAYGLTDIYKIGEWYYSIGDFMIYIGSIMFGIFSGIYLALLTADYIKCKRNILHNKLEEAAIKG